jgi:hypothetical protein
MEELGHAADVVIMWVGCHDYREHVLGLVEVRQDAFRPQTVEQASELPGGGHVYDDGTPVAPFLVRRQEEQLGVTVADVEKEVHECVPLVLDFADEVSRRGRL